MRLTHNFRRGISLAVPLFTVMMFWGLTDSFFGLNSSTNIIQTGVTFGFIMGSLNAFLLWMIFKHKVP